MEPARYARARTRDGPADGIPNYNASVRDRATRTGTLQLEEPVRTSDEEHAVPQPPRGLASRDGAGHRAEERDGLVVWSWLVVCRGAEVLYDRVETGVLARAQRLVVVGAVRRLGELRGQPRLGQCGEVQVTADRRPAVMDAGAERGVQAAQHLAAVLLLGRDGHADRPPRVAQPLGVPLLQVLAAVVQHGQAHDVEAHPAVAYLLHFQQPPRGDPRPRALGVEPHADTGHAVLLILVLAGRPTLGGDNDRR